MGRSIRVKSECLQLVNDSLHQRRPPLKQEYLADSIPLAQSTVSNFLTGKPVDVATFKKICSALDLDWEKIVHVETERILVSEPQPPSPSLPKLQLAFPRGAVSSDSPFYINRSPQEQACYNEITNPSSLIRIKAPRKSGKSSLLISILEQAKHQGDCIVQLNLNWVEQGAFKDIRTLLNWVCAEISISLGFSDQLEKYATLARRTSCNLAFISYLETYILPHLSGALTLGIDEIDRLFEFKNIYQDFFSLLRSMTEKGKAPGIWRNFRLIIVHSTEAYIQLPPTQSPFNVGLPIELPEFTPEQIQELADRHQLNWTSNQTQQLMAMIGGHPYLVNLALYYLSRENITLEQLLNTPLEQGIYQEELAHLARIIEEQPELDTAMKQLIESGTEGTFLSSPACFKLQGLGLAKLENGKATVTHKLHQMYFSQRYSRKQSIKLTL
jgi:transcriptional regulator with XRE-family HTH domain